MSQRFFEDVLELFGIQFNFLGLRILGLLGLLRLLGLLGLALRHRPSVRTLKKPPDLVENPFLRNTNCKFDAYVYM